MNIEGCKKMEDIIVNEPAPISVKSSKKKKFRRVGPKRDFSVYLFDWLVKGLIIALLISIDFLVFSSAGNFSIFSSGFTVAPEVFFIIGGIFAVALCLMFLISFSSFLQNVVAAGTVGFFVYLMLNQFALFDKASFLSYLLSPYLGNDVALHFIGNSDIVAAGAASVVAFVFFAMAEKKNIAYFMPVSKNLLDSYQDKVNIKMQYIPLALNYYPKDSELSKLNNKNLIAIGRLDKVKGFNDLITIMNDVVNKDSEIKLNIFGDGPEKENLQALIKEKHLEKNIKLWGFKKYTFIKDYLANSSLYLMTSFEESFGLVVIEAMSYGIPCIAFDSAKGVLDVLNASNGYLISNRNLEEYSDTILKYLNLTSKEKKKISKNARATATKYSFDNVQKEYLYFITKVLNDRKQGIKIDKD